MPTILRGQLNYLRIPPRKTRAVASVIKGLSVNEAEARLLMMPRRSGIAILKLLKSVAQNAKQQKLQIEKMYVKEIRVDQGPKYKRWTPRARGGVGRIEKKTSHVTIFLEAGETVKSNRFVIKEKEKKEKKVKKERNQKEKDHEDKKVPEKPVERRDFFQKVFRRKSI